MRSRPRGNRVVNPAICGSASRADLGGRRHGAADGRRGHPQGAGRTDPLARGARPRACRLLRVARAGHDHPVRRQLHRRSLRPGDEAAHAHRRRGYAHHVDRFLARGGAAQIRVPRSGAARHHRHDDDDLGQRSHRALCRARAAEPRALRGRRLRPPLGAIERGRHQIFRPRRALLGHAALRRVADLRLHRLDARSPTSPPPCSPRAPISASSSGSCS